MSDFGPGVRFVDSKSEFTSAGWLFCFFRGWRSADGASVKLEYGGQMLREVRPVVAAGIDMKFVRDSAGRELFVQCLCAYIEAVIIV